MTCSQRSCGAGDAEMPGVSQLHETLRICGRWGPHKGSIPTEVETIPTEVETIPTEVESFPTEVETIPTAVERSLSQRSQVSNRRVPCGTQTPFATRRIEFLCGPTSSRCAAVRLARTPATARGRQ